MYMVMFVLDDSDRLDEVLDAWRAIGVSGVTIVETTGAYRRQLRRRVLGARYTFGRGMGAANVEVGHHTLFVIVPDETLVHACTQAAERIVGDLDQPNTGVLAAWRLDIVKGVSQNPREEPDRSEDEA